MSIKLESVELTNIVTYKHAKFSFDAPLCVIRGHNMDRKSKESANAVGKSLLFSMLPTIRYATPPSSDRKKTAKVVHSKGSAASITFSKGGNKYRVTQKMHGSSLKLLLEKNGKDLGFRESDVARKYFEHKMDISEDQFYTLHYLDVYRPSNLLKAPASKRFDLFEQLFEMHVYDAIHKAVSKRYNELKLGMHRLDTLKEQRDEIKQMAPTIKMSAAQKQHTKLTKRHEKYTAKVEEAYAALNSLNVFIAVAGKDVSELSLEELKEKRAKLRKKLQTLRESKAEAVAYHSLVEAHSASKKRIAKLKARIAEIPSDDFLDKMKGIDTEIDSEKEKLRELKGALTRLATDHEESTTARNTYRAQHEKLAGTKNLNALQNKVREDKDFASTLREKMSVSSSALRTFKKLVEDMEGHDISCPTCSQHVSMAFVKKAMEKEREACAGYKRKLDIVVDVALLLDLRKTAESHESPTKLSAMMVEVENSIKAKKELIEKLEQAERRQRLQSKLRDIEPVKLGEKQPKPESFDDDIAKAEAAIEHLAEAINVKKSVAELDHKWDNLDEAKKLAAKHQGTIDTIGKELSELNTKLQQLSGNIEKAKLSRKQLKRIDGEIEKEKTQAEDFDIYSKLRDAYGAKGLRLIQIEAMAHEYVAGLNAMSHLIFPESIKFDYKIGNNVFNIMATRSGVTSDIRFLSASESRAFILLSVLAIMPFIDPSKRLDVLVCDEIESGMDTLTQKLFVTDFLPVLMGLIPKVILITPKSKKEFFVPTAKEYVVVKQNSESRITCP